MFGSEILDVAIGLILVYLLLSLFATAVREGIESVVKARAVLLERGIRELLDDPTGRNLSRQLYEHPLIYSLFRDAYEPREKRMFGGKLPTYIPARNFTVALLDLAVRGPAVMPAGTSGASAAPSPYAPLHTSPAFTDAELRAAVTRLPSVRVQRALLTAIDGTEGDLARVHANVEAWFNGAMDRVSGWYKRRTQYWLFFIGLGVTIALNINTVTVANHLARNRAAREALVARAQAISQDSTYRRLVRDTVAQQGDLTRRLRELDALDLPIGWDRALPRPTGSGTMVLLGYWLTQPIGLLLTALAITLGAPFWFDALNRIMTVRSTVKPATKPVEERPASPAAPSGAAAPSAPAPRMAIPPGGIAPASAVAVMSASAAPPVGAPSVEPDFVPHRWAVGDADEGVL